MGELLRSKAIERIQLIVQSDAAYDIIDEIRKLEVAQFIDVLSFFLFMQERFKSIQDSANFH